MADTETKQVSMKELFEQIEEDAGVKFTDLELIEFFVWYAPKEGWAMQMVQDPTKLMTYAAEATKAADRLTVTLGQPWPINPESKVVAIFEDADEWRIYTCYMYEEGKGERLTGDKIPPPRKHTLSKHAAVYSTAKMSSWTVFKDAVSREMRLSANLDEEERLREEGADDELEAVVEYVKAHPELLGPELAKNLEQEEHRDDEEP